MENKIERFWIEDGWIYVLAGTGDLYRQALSAYPGLAGASPEQWMIYEVSAGGLHWPALDVDISLKGLIAEGEGPLLVVTDAEYVGGWKFRVDFSDGVTREVDLTDCRDMFAGQGRYGFSPVEEYAVERGNIRWANGVVFPVDRLYGMGIEVSVGPEDCSGLRRFFRENRAISVRGFARMVGINPTLMSNYVNGHKRPSRARLDRIREGIRELGRLCLECRI